uniref:enoyl-CoA hydratase-related protein n=1 Tax=Thaumasiovibrio occultus TaxID=1891184 RepID=UPI000B356A29|nr:enoyl-CoA hydratase-related protein [Thaumasiovibrio occultus]
MVTESQPFSSTNSPLLDERPEAGVRYITLNQAAQHNRLTAPMMKALIEVFTTPDCRVLILAADGKIFCGGADLNWMKVSDSDEEKDNTRASEPDQLAHLLSVMDNCPVPIAVTVKGDVYGGGLGLLACADIVFSNELSQYCFSEARLGLIPALISPYVLRACGLRQLMPLLISASPFSAAHAEHIGLVHALSFAPKEDALRWARQSMLCGPEAITSIKRLGRKLQPLNPIELARVRDYLEQCRHSDEAQAGIAAFFAKQPPPWQSPSDD